jgi:hypothetical protein
MSTDPNRGQYEFNEQENAVIADLASGVRIVGFVLFLLGVLQAIGLFATLNNVKWDGRFAGPALLIGAAALIYLSFGWWFSKSSSAFMNVATTQGRDIDNLMVGLNELRKPFSLIRTLILVYAVIVVVGLIAVLIQAFTHRPPAA